MLACLTLLSAAESRSRSCCWSSPKYSVPPPDTWHKGLVGGDVQAEVFHHLLDVVERLLRRRVVAPPPHDEGRLSPPKVGVRRA